MDEFSVLEQVTREVTLGGKPLKVSPLKVGQIPAFTRAIRPVFAALADLIRSIPSEGGSGKGGEADLSKLAVDFDLERIADLIAEHGDTLIEAAAVAVREKPEVIREVALDEFVSLVRAIVEVNVDFFGRAVAKAIGASKANGAGLTLSSS